MKVLVFSMLLLVGVAGCNKQDAKVSTASSSTDVSQAVSGPFTNQELQQFTALNPIDTHTHVFRSEPEFDAMLAKLNLKILDIIVVDDQEQGQTDLAAESKAAWNFVHGSAGHAVFCASFDPYKINDRGFTPASISWVDGQFKQGAIAVKVWKNLGMEIKDPKGNYILPDNPALDPIYKNIASHGITLIAHVADPNTAWNPPNPDAPDYSYFVKNPVWYMHDKPNAPSKEQILQARDHILEQNPNLRVVGAHLGSMEADFGELGQHLDKYPNFAVDLAARMPYLMMQPHADMIAFITKYQDRLIYGTDNGFAAKDKMQPKIDSWEQSYARDWRYFATNDTLEYRGHPLQGLALPPAILRKIYHDNAVHWFPGMLSASH